MRYIIAICAVMIASSAWAGQTAYLREPGSMIARMEDEVGLWKTEAAAAKAQNIPSVIGKPAYAQLECIVKPGTKAEVLSKKGKVAYVQDRHTLFGGCKGYVRSDFLSPN